MNASARNFSQRFRLTKIFGCRQSFLSSVNWSTRERYKAKRTSLYKFFKHCTAHIIIHHNNLSICLLHINIISIFQINKISFKSIFICVGTKTKSASFIYLMVRCCHLKERALNLRCKKRKLLRENLCIVFFFF